MNAIYLIGLALIGILIAAFTPWGLGLFIVLGVIFAVTIANYRRTRELHAGMEEIRRHLGLMEQDEARSYDLEREVRRADGLDEQERAQIDRLTEEELQRDAGTK
ncbi:hypothetical protein CDO73_12395 [Saccharibacillus sp. O23]|uniref:hypothetical protein n=1 Tax=Saccharibacillus sp. O23 TaxID=2009338 RepID=UPI000B4E7051|nr:hypothetical protein [Saccharibacillus sp. O23]OWR29877.1 hypothetical protein CDO73_12395 [Saccharibacillus sp. O23]